MPNRKLPVIQVATMNNGGSLAKDADGFGLFHEHDNMGQFEMGFVLYEPMRPRCKTCSSFGNAPTPPDAPYCSWHATYYVKPDGSGYCHDHSELRSA